ncbi:unnamed protein product, partial [Scytosiphon promiscuus]
MPPKGRGGTARKSNKGSGKGAAVKSKSILSFFSAPVAAGSTRQQSTSSASAPPESASSPPLGREAVEASTPRGLVDLTDESGGRASCSHDPGAEGGAIGSKPAPPEFKRDCLDPAAGGRTAAGGGAGTRSSSSSSSGGKTGMIFGGGRTIGTTGARQGTEGGNSGFVRASSLISGTNRPTAMLGSGGGTSMATSMAPSMAPTTTTTTIPPMVVSAPSAPKSIAGKVPLAVPGSSASTPSSTSTSSWGSLGRRPQLLSSNSWNKPILLPLHVVGLQFRENRASDAWPPPTATGSSQPSPPAGGQHNTSDGIGSNTTLQLEREPHNSHDPNAIKVLLPPLAGAPSPFPSSQASEPGARFLGYIPGRIAVLLAPVLDASPGKVARVALKTVEEEDAPGQVVGGGPRNTLPALLEVQPLGGAGREPFLGLMAKLREAAKKEDKRQQKRRGEAKAHQERLRSKQKTLLLDFGRSSSGSGAAHGGGGGRASASASGSAQGGEMLESMPWEVLWQVFCSPGISSRELFGPIRSVCGNWMRAVDAMPCAAARKDVAKVCAGEPVDARKQMDKEGVREERRRAKGEGGRRKGEVLGPSHYHGEAIGGSRQSDATVAGPEGTPGVGKGEGDGYRSSGGGQMRKGAPCWWDVVRARLVQGGGFTECAAKDVLERLEWAAELEEDEDEVDDLDDSGGANPEEGGAAASSGVPGSDHNDGGEESNGEEGGGGGNDDGIPCGGRKRRRMLRHLHATRALCEEWGLLKGAAGTATGPSSSGGGWSGWEAFGLAVATSASRDRLSLCCWVVRPLMGGDTDDRHNMGTDREGRQWRQRRGPSCPGLPRGEVIELLCLILCALRSPEGGSTRGARVGTVRLEADLLVCARVLENWDVRFQKAGQPGGGGGDRNSNSGGGGGASGLIANLTAEQRSIVLADVKAGGVLTVLAFAGTGKTTCLRAYAQARPHLKILYLTFNVSVREEAEKTFPPHVACKGVHQLAFRFVGRRFQSKLTQDLRESDVQAFLKDRLGKEVAAHLGVAPPTAKRSRRSAAPVEDATLLEWVAMAWAEMQSTPGPRGSRGEAGEGYGQAEGGEAAGSTPPATLGMTHAGYLKLFQLSRPSLGRTYDVIMLDEAQDSNPCIANIVLRETACARILVGDSHQARRSRELAIYGFIGAEDHLKRVEGGKVRHLTQVFRFDQSIAHAANSLVGPLKGETRPLLGNAGKNGKVVLADGTGLGVWQEQGCMVKRPIAFLARTVAALVHAATWARSRGEKVAWVGGAGAYSLDAIEDMCLMAIGRSEEVKHPLLKKLKTTKRLTRFIQESGDRQWASRLRMLEGKDANDLLAELRELQRKQVHPREADTILSTVHKAKGLEFDTVVLADDFIEVDTIRWTNDPYQPRPIWGSAGEIEEVNILYVAVTRAKRRLVANSSLRAFLAMTGAWNSVCLRGVAIAAGTSNSSGSNGKDKCASCGRNADVGGGGCRLERLSRAKGGSATEQVSGGRGFSSTSSGGASDSKGGLLYAESGSLRPLCCWCVEGNG